ncbi:SusC/RagA family TonB-linked outer membrane protein [Lacibacter luteus]|uniref:SusC/RagA family TonB-linked outer membrane protein n=1 Tax=Lacibacter luteus TaxID=2508719 RepID=A0A4Q1CL51_9BACT|nr:SusC/RagA family TonB-linked outer membrane protein [Lacibacter luteus]RXK61696.1 SusC/RagA family TonB-linked outer membrane protein [Lacibacter luteus]
MLLRRKTISRISWRKKLLAMNLTVVLLLTACLQLSAGGFAQNVTLTEKNAPLQKIFRQIHKQTGYQFFYEDELLNKAGRININVKETPLEKALAICFENLPLTYKIVNKAITVMHKKVETPVASPSTAPAVIEVNGQVTDEEGKPLAGASVKIKGSALGKSTDAGGNFSLELPDAGGVLIISFIGYQTTEIAVTKAGNITVKLKPEETNMEEVVVTALGIKREEKQLGYAVQKVKAESVQTVKGVDMATSLTGQVSGLVIKNSTEFFARPTVELRGEGALLVVDGVAYGNMTLRDIPTDDIESINVLKGPTASALYGARASGGVLMVTTKKASAKGLSVNINSNTMFQLGFLAIPEVQSNYGRGQYGQIDNDYVWGPKLNAGNTARDWNPVTMQFEDNRPMLSLGKNNLKNFMQTGIVTNNNISVAQGGQNGGFRASFNHIHNKGQFPNAKLNMYNFTLSGEIKASDKFNLEGRMGVSRRQAPQIWGTGYGNQGYLYQLIMWTGPEYDIRDYRNYWKVPNKTQNWMYDAWYDNPYLIAYEKLNGIEQNTINASVTANYKFTNDLKLMLRLGYDVYSNTQTWRNPTSNIFSTRGGWNARGWYSINKTWGWSTDDDVMLSYEKKLGQFSIDAIAGANIYRWVDEGLSASTRNGLTSPTFFSLNGSVEPATITPAFQSYQKNSLYSRASIGWKNGLFIDFTGRNDWISAQPKNSRSYFYPSIGSSVVLSEFIKMPRFVDMWKVRGSWATFKTPAGVYATNRLYSTTTLAWNTMNSASYPDNLFGGDLLPTSARTWEVGTSAYLFKKRLHLDVAYFNKYYFNRQVSSTIPASSGFNTTLINTKETYVRKGFEITVDGSLIKKKKFEWYSTVNWSNQHRYYVDLDSTLSAKDLWTKKGARLDNYLDYYWLTDAQGNVIHNNGRPVDSDYRKRYGYTDPVFSFGFINTFTFGQFMAGLNIDGRIGGLMYNYVYDKMWDTGTNPESDNQYRYDETVNGLTNYVGKGVKVISGSVTYDNFGNIISDTRKYAINDVPVSYQDYAQNFRGGDFGVQKKTFVKLREISAGYRVPAKFFGKSGIKTLSVALTAQNVLLLTKFKFSDPDVDDENLNAPSQRVVGFNVKIGF